MEPLIHQNATTGTLVIVFFFQVVNSYCELQNVIVFILFLMKEVRVTQFFHFYFPSHLILIRGVVKYSSGMSPRVTDKWEGRSFVS